MFKPLVIIPVYNHHSALADLCRVCREHNWPVLMVDDASNLTTQATIERLTDPENDIYSVRHAKNGGKGAAVITALFWAREAGFTHAMQIDADAQQDATEIPTFMKAAQKLPQHVICGTPVYDATVPTSRKFGRKLTNFWVAVNTVSLAIDDAMCGFRCYPVEASCHTLEKAPKIGRRMDFDPEFLVRLYWDGLDLVNLPVAVTYPADGISHFKAVENWYISKMHTRCFFGMLLRLPRLLMRHFR